MAKSLELNYRLKAIIFETMHLLFPSWDPDILVFSDQVFGDQNCGLCLFKTESGQHNEIDDGLSKNMCPTYLLAASGFGPV